MPEMPAHPLDIIPNDDWIHGVIEERDAYRTVLFHLIEALFEKVQDEPTREMLIGPVDEAVRALHHYNCDDCSQHEELPSPQRVVRPPAATEGGDD